MMTLTITHLGIWQLYQPEVWPEELPKNTLFCRRESDGVDWYEFRKSLRDDTVKMTVADMVGGFKKVQIATRDVSMVWPVNALLLEVDGITEDDPQETYRWMEFLPETNSFQPMAPELINPPSPIDLLMTEIKALRERLEAKT